jgi:peptidyl-tRNA hydrolase
MVTEVQASRELVLPLVVRLERETPPARTDALEAAARAVLMMLTSDEPEWVEAVAEWEGHRIRKVVRRARGVQWRRAAALPGLSLTHRSAEVRVYPPIPLDRWPAELVKLQVGGTELEDPEPVGPADHALPLVLLAPGLAMSAGKAMAQAGHAAQLGYRAASADQRLRWIADGFALSVRDATPAQWRAAVAAGAPVVRDAGFTEVEPGSFTAAFVAASG